MSEINFEQARFNMIEQQIRPWDVLDQQVLDILSQVPREDFVPSPYRKLAFADTPIPLGHGQFMMNPNLEGRLLQSLGIRPSDRILEIGTGSGYLAACLAHLGASVLSVDIFPEFTQTARQNLDRHRIKNVRLQTGDGARDWNGKFYEAIALTGSLPTLPDSWRRRLAIGGRLFAVVGTPPVMEALLVTRVGEQEWNEESLFETELPPLLNSHEPTVFEF
jgi:protein-L-isoaspartate(D-aspartate) O-methyltransferase